MKIAKLNIGMFSKLAVVLFLLLSVACKKNDSLGGFDSASLDANITEAKNLIAQSVEGSVPGNFKPGSKKTLQEVIDWAAYTKENASSADKVTDAANKVKIYIDRFKSNIVKLAIPYIHQDNKTYIEIADNVGGGGTAGAIHNLTSKSYTLEAKFYILDLNPKGYAGEFFANAMGNGGANDRGFELRYFADGHVDINVGGGTGWKTKSTANGVIAAGKWIHVTFVNNITSQTLYVDGVQVATQTELYQNSDVDFPLTIGNIKTWDDRTINGLVKDFRLWSEARTAAQIAENKDIVLTGKETNLSVFFPLNADLGSSVVDGSSKFVAKLTGNVTWALDGIPPVIVLDKTALNKAKTDLVAFTATVVEGTALGAYPLGTKAYLQTLATEADNVLSTAKRQDELDGKASSINAQIALVKSNTVAPADGVFIDLKDANATGLRITPNYTPQGDYTVEFNVKIKSLAFEGTGDLFNNGNFGVWVYGYKESTEEAILKSGGLWNFTDAGKGWQGPKTDPLVIKSGVWQHVAVVHDNTARTTVLYVDGVEKARQTDIGAPNVSGWGETWLGNGWEKMNGYIKNYRLWNVAKAPADLNSSITGSETGLETYLPLDQVAGVKFSDATNKYKAELKGIKWNLK